MPLVRIDAKRIVDWNSFHDVFSETFGFPAFYGRNMDSWIDCMTCLDDVESGMTNILGTATNPVILQLDNIDFLPREIYEAVVESAAFVNWRRIQQNLPVVLALSFYKTASTVN